MRLQVLSTGEALSTGSNAEVLLLNEGFLVKRMQRQDDGGQRWILAVASPLLASAALEHIYCDVPAGLTMLPPAEALSDCW